MDERTQPEQWHARADDEGQISIYDSRGFVAAVSDRPTAMLLVAHHNAAIYRLGEHLFYERWGSEVNYELWQQAVSALAAADLPLAPDLPRLAEDLRARLRQVYAERFPNSIASPRHAADATVTVVMDCLEAALRANGAGGRS